MKKFWKFGDKAVKAPIPPKDPTGWIITSSLAEFLLLHIAEVKYMAMFGYTYMHGMHLFDHLPAGSSLVSLSYKFTSLVLECTGGGILVPLFLNMIPVALAHDAYPIAICVSFVLHQYLPILREVTELSPILRVCFIILYEAYRAHVVVEFTHEAALVIQPSEFQFAVFGPIICGAISGCGYAFVPLNKGLDPIKYAGLSQSMVSAFVGAAFYHMFVNTALSSGIIHADEKAHVVIAICFTLHHLYEDFFANSTTHESHSTAESKKHS